MKADQARRVLKESEKHRASTIGAAVATLMQPEYGEVPTSVPKKQGTEIILHKAEPLPVPLDQQPHLFEAEVPQLFSFRTIVSVATGILPSILIATGVLSRHVSKVDRLWNNQLYLVTTALIGVVILAGTLVITTSRRRRFILCVGAAAIILSSSIVCVSLEAARKHTQAERIAMLRDVHWIAFDPVGFDPFRDIYPDEESIGEDLAVLKSHGFTGIITFGNNKSLERIPYIANEMGLRVIMGLWIPPQADKKPEDEFAKARKAAQAGVVDAFCVGHVRAESTDLSTLAEWMDGLRRETGLPVTHTAPIVNYIGNRGKQLREIGDWYFPDVGGAWRINGSVEASLRRTREDVTLAAQLPHDKPVLLKMIGFPSGPKEAGFTAEKQKEFFLGFIRDRSFPHHVFPSYAASFDRPSTAQRRHDQPASRYLGFFTDARQPKPVTEVFRSHWKVPAPMPAIRGGSYATEEMTDVSTGSTEFRLLIAISGEKYHFGSVIQTSTDALIFKPIPGESERDGGSVSLYLAPFVGDGSESGGLEVTSIDASQDGVSLKAEGKVAAAFGSAGTWAIETQIGCTGPERIVGHTKMEVRLDNNLAEIDGDLNVIRLSSNFLDNGNIGNTSGVEWSSSPGGFVTSFVPSANINATYPQERSGFLDIYVLENSPQTGEGKWPPLVKLQLTSKDAELSFGARWNKDSEADDFDVTPLVLTKTDPPKTMRIDYSFEATPSKR